MKNKKTSEGVGYRKGMPSSEHWEKDVSKSVYAEGGNDPAGAFLARKGKNRPQPHLKINECDH